jgi:hypothetical protein
MTLRVSCLFGQGNMARAWYSYVGNNQVKARLLQTRLWGASLATGVIEDMPS